MAHARLALLAIERGGEQVGHRGEPLAVLGRERADGGRVHGDDPEGAGAPADRGAGGAADAAAAQGGAVEAALAGPLPDDDGLVAGEHPAGEQAGRGWGGGGGGGPGGGGTRARRGAGAGAAPGG